MSKWAELRDKMKQNDERRLEDMNGFYSSGATIENMIALANARAVDALAVLSMVLTHLDEQDKETVSYQRYQPPTPINDAPDPPFIG